MATNKSDYIMKSFTRQHQRKPNYADYICLKDKIELPKPSPKSLFKTFEVYLASLKVG